MFLNIFFHLSLIHSSVDFFSLRASDAAGFMPSIVDIFVTDVIARVLLLLVPKVVWCRFSLLVVFCMVSILCSCDPHSDLTSFGGLY